MNNSNILDKIDTYFEKKSESEKWLIILLFAAVVMFLVYSTFYASSKSVYDRSLANHLSIKKQINIDNNYLNSISKNGDRNYKIKSLDRKIAMDKKTLDNFKVKIVMIKKSFTKLSRFLFGNDVWSSFLNSLTQKAADNNVKINKLSNRYVDSNKSFGHVLEIGLNCTGKFHDILKFVNDMEQSTLVTDVYRSNTYSDSNSSTLMSDINISVWGINHNVQ